MVERFKNQAFLESQLQVERQVRFCESYDYIEGFAKQIAKTPAKLDLAELPAGFGFQYELKLTDTTENESKPVLDSVTLNF
jgi:FKBP-type peptidyl-prolyl cis-trans isomerase 2